MARMARESIFSSSHLRTEVRCSSNCTNCSLADSCSNSATSKNLTHSRSIFIRDFLPSPQDFSDRPGLGDAAAGRERSVAIENFAEGAEAARINLAPERL